MADERIQRVTMPKWGLSMTAGTITEWIVAEGDAVAPGDDLAEIDTEKIAGALESTWEGMLRRIVAGVGSSVPVGATIAVVAPAEVADDEVDAVVALAREQLAAGITEEPDEGVEVGTVEVDGRSISYATMGDAADVVVLVHGYGGDKNSWLFVQEPLSHTHTVHALDLPGHGESSKDVGDGSVDAMAAAVLGFLDARGIDRAHLVGHSFGGAVVAAVAARSQGRVRSLTLVAPAGFGADVDAEYLRGFATATSRRQLRPLVGRLFADESLVTRQLVDDLLRYKRIDGVDAALGRLVDTMLDGDRQRIDTAGRLGAVDVPAVVVWGRQDRILPPPGEAPAARNVHLVDGAGHMVHMERPAEVRHAIDEAVAAGAG
jgi:pyruvate dehydrogenase E2 component (dihydrolipoamide acetyltransferase)